MAIRICQRCGQEFETTDGVRKAMFCSESGCQAFKRQRHLTQMREANKKARGKRGKKEVKETPVPNGYYCQKCKAPLTGARRFNCKKCEQNILDVSRCGNDWLYLPNNIKNLIEGE